MKKKPVIGWFILILLLFNIMPINSSNEIISNNIIYVDDDYTSNTPGWNITRFAKIQPAIDTAETGDTIFIFEGHYPETLIIDKTITITGNSTESVLINGTDYSEALITINADHTTLSKVTIQGKGKAHYPRCSCILVTGDQTIITDIDSYDTDYVITLQSSNSNTIAKNHLHNSLLSGVRLEESHYNHIDNNTIHGISYGIEAINSDYNIVRDNEITGDEGSLSYCILLMSSNSIFIYNNTISTSCVGFFIVDTEDTIIQKNFIHVENGICGIFLDYSTHCSVIENTIQGDNTNSYGIWVEGTNNSDIIRNTITRSLQGMLIGNSIENTFTDNAISENIQGIMMKTSKNNIIEGNNIHNNFYGIKLSFSRSNTIYNNIFSNEKNVEVDFLGLFSWNKWNIRKTEGENIIGGSYLGGNFWNGPNGYTGNDKDGDGIGGRWYFIGITGIDFAPLVDH